MIRGTSIPLSLKVNGSTLASCTNIRAIIRQNDYIIEKEVTAVAGTASATIEVPLTIQETLKFTEGTAEVQVVWTNALGLKDATNTVVINILKILKEEMS